MSDIPPMPHALGEVCQHDKLKRQCEVCRLEWEVQHLRAEIERLRAIVGKLPRDEDVRDIEPITGGPQ